MEVLRVKGSHKLEKTEKYTSVLSVQFKANRSLEILSTGPVKEEEEGLHGSMRLETQPCALKWTGEFTKNSLAVCRLKSQLILLFKYIKG